MLVSECAAPESAKIPGHLTPSEAGRIAAMAGVKKLVLTHFYPECDRNDMITPCGKEFDGPIILAEDMMHLIA
jgi:ribonuclease BN (tRNA processing enzyme)